MVSIIDAIFAISGGTAEVGVKNEGIDNIEWLNGTTPIPKADIEAKMAELQAEYDAKQYQRDRVREYPNHNDCIHALLDGGDTLTDLQAKRQATKLKFPKP
jgi:hypothetical protein